MVDRTLTDMMVNQEHPRMALAIALAEERIASGEYTRASQLLDEVSKDQRRVLTLHDLAHWYLLRSICYRESSDYLKARSHARVALRLLRPSSEHILFARAKQSFGNLLSRVGDSSGAVEAYIEAYAAFKRANCLDRLYGAMTNLGLAYFAKGELLMGESCLLQAVNHAKSHNTTREVALCTLNLLRVRIIMGDAANCGRLLAPSDGEDRFGRRYFESYEDQVRGIAFVFLGNYRASVTLLRRAHGQFRSKNANRDVTVCLEYLGLNEYFAGNYRKAKEYYQQVLDMPEPTASAVAQTLRMMTDVHIAEGQWDLARGTVAKADTAITKISERIELGALWRAYGHIHAHDGNRDEARALFTKSIELLRQLGARYELALSHFDAGRSQVFSEAERGEHLQIARALFVEMEVSKRVAQVDAVIAEREDAHHFDRKPASKQRLTLKTPSTPTIVAASEAMKRIVALADKVKNSDLTILITGETGTGKDLLAEYIHKTSNRAARPFVVTNCAALPEALIEAELFGYRRGSYSGASSDKPGLIESANGGTFVFDEIGEIPVALQAKLLRVIDTKIIRRIGEVADVQIDVRFIALTNRNLEQMVREGTFRSDLYHRLCQMPIHLPPLRERPEDIVPLAIMLLARCGIAVDGGALAAALRDQLEAYPWPGNARELIAIITRVAALLDGNGNSDVFELLRQQLGAPDAEGSERRRLFEALRRHDGNKSKVAEELGLPRTTLNSQLKKYNL